MLTARFNPKGLIVTAAGAFVFWLAVQTRAVATVDFALIAFWMLLLVALSVAMVAGTLRGRRVVGQAGAFRELRRWVRSLGNPGAPPR